MNLKPLTAALQKATPEQKAARLEICRACPERKTTPIERCGRCGCPLASKTHLQRASCPLRKW